MNLGNCVFVLDGKEMAVTNVEVTYEAGDLTRATVEGILTEFNVKEDKKDMSNTRCDASDDYQNLSMVAEYRRLSLTPDDKLLKKHGILNEYGGLSYDGRDFVLEVWFNENKDKVVEALKAIEEARKAEKK